MITKTYEEIKLEVIAILRTKYPQLNIFGLGDLYADSIVEIVSYIYKLNLDYVDILSRLQIIDEMATLPEADLDIYFAGWNLTRNAGNAALGEVTLYSYSFSGNKGLSIGDRISGQTDDGEMIYEVSEDYTFLPANKLNYYSATNDRYEFTVNVVAEDVGTGHNIGPYVVNAFVDAFSGYEGVYNREAIVGGTDIESNDEFVERFKTTLLGVNLGSYSSYLKVIADSSLAVDGIKVVGYGDDDMVRDYGTGGKVDVYVESARELITETQTFSAIDILSNVMMYLNQQPVVAFKGVTFTDGDPTTVITSVIDDSYKFEAESTSAKSGILVSGALPTSIEVEYTYDKTVQDFQVLFTDDNYLANADVLVKRGEEFELAVSADVRAYSGYSFLEVEINIISALATYIDGLSFGDRIEQADILFVMKGADGVDNIRIPLTALCREGSSGVGDIELGTYQFPIMGTVTLTEY